MKTTEGRRTASRFIGVRGRKKPHTARRTLSVFADLPPYPLDLLTLPHVPEHVRPEQPEQLEPAHGQRPEPELVPEPALVHAGCTLVGRTAGDEPAGALYEGPVVAVAVAVGVVAVTAAHGYCEDEDS